VADEYLRTGIPDRRVTLHGTWDPEWDSEDPMTVECIRCGTVLRGKGKDFRARLKVTGWVWFLLGTDLYWRCGNSSCAAKG
jgi:hypothetical protein